MIDSGVFILGPEGRAFEKEFSEMTGLPPTLGVASGTSALELALTACGVGPGDEVIVPTFTFIATATAASVLGAKVVLADIDWETMTLSVEDTKRKLTAKTKAIVPVHLFGQPADMDGFRALKRAIVEDCAQSHMATYKGRACGGLGDVSCFSFYPSKNIGALGDAGAVSSKDPEIFKTIETLRNCGRKPGGAAYLHERVGFNCRLDEMQAALLRVKLKKLAEWTKKRRALAKLYDDALTGLPLTLPPMGGKGSEPVFHLYVIRTPRRDALAAYLKERGIGTGVYYPIPVHRQPAYAALAYKDGDFPNSERASREALALPMFPELPKSDALAVAKAVRAFFAS